MGYTVTCMAPTGISTSTLPNGRTIHNYPGINPTAKPGTFYSLLRGEQLIRFQNRLKHKGLAIFILDEMSWRRLRNIMGVDEPNGGFTVILLGDSFQSTWIQMGLSVDPDLPTHNYSVGSKWSSLNKKCAEPTIQRIQILQPMCNPSKRNREYPNAINRLKTISPRDIQEDQSWASMPIVVTGNKKRILLNEFQSKIWSVRHRRPRFVWRCQLSEQNPDMVNLTSLQRNYSTKTIHN